MARLQLSDEVASYVRGLIVSGQLMPNNFVRVDRIAEELEISPTPVREGLLLLRGEGFLHLEPRRGFVVAALTSEDLDDVFWLQGQLAGELAARAVLATPAVDVDALMALQDRLNVALKRSEFAEVERLNHEFHRTINLAAGSPKLQWFLRTAARYVPDRFYHQIDGWPDASAHDHVSILAAFKTKDPAAARTAMANHIVHAGHLLTEHRTTSASAADPAGGVIVGKQR